MSEQLPDPVTKRGRPLPLVLADAGFVQRDGAEGEVSVLLVQHERHDLHVLQACDGLSVDVCDQVLRSQPCVPRLALLVNRLQGRVGERERETEE